MFAKRDRTAELNMAWLLVENAPRGTLVLHDEIEKVTHFSRKSPAYRWVVKWLRSGF